LRVELRLHTGWHRVFTNKFQPAQGSGLHLIGVHGKDTRHGQQLLFQGVYFRLWCFATQHHLAVFLHVQRHVRRVRQALNPLAHDRHIQ